MQIIASTSVLHLLWQIALQWNISPDEAQFELALP